MRVGAWVVAQDNRCAQPGALTRVARTVARGQVARRVARGWWQRPAGVCGRAAHLLLAAGPGAHGAEDVVEPGDLDRGALVPLVHLEHALSEQLLPAVPEDVNQAQAKCGKKDY